MSMSTIAPVYARETYNSNSRSSLVVEEPVVEHEHHHLHHHIDHGNMNSMSLTRRGERTSIHDGVEEDRRYTSNVSIVKAQNDQGHRHHHHRRRSGGMSRSEVDLSLSQNGSRRGSVQLSGTSDWTIIDVPPGTRRITIDTAQPQQPQQSQEEDVSWSRYNGVRRSHGVSSEVWTEITKDLVTRQAIEDLGYQFEETDHFYYIFDYLNKDQINDLIKLTKDIRRERARELEYNSIAGSRERDYNQRLIEPPRHERSHERHGYDDHPEIIYTEEQTRRRSRKYYH